MSDDKDNVLHLFGDPTKGPKEISEALSKVAVDLSGILLVGQLRDGNYFVARHGESLEFFAVAKIMVDRMVDVVADVMLEDQDGDQAE